MKFKISQNNTKHLDYFEIFNHWFISTGGYDPLTHGGYGNMDDYAHYPQLTSASPDYSTHSHAPSRQDYIHSGHLQPADKSRRRDPHLGMYQMKPVILENKL